MRTCLVALLWIALVGCEPSGDPGHVEAGDFNASDESVESDESDETRAVTVSEEELRARLASYEVEGLDPVPELNEELVDLGRDLFFDPLLSGNKDISCATCHNPCQITGDDRSLSVGTAAVFDGSLRIPGKDRIFIARHATELFNRGDSRWTTMFWDTRLVMDEAGRIVERNPVSTASGMTPPETPMPDGLDNLLAAQALFAVSSRHEMRGRPGDVDIDGNPNELAAVTDTDLRTIWGLLSDRVMEVDEYRERFQRVYPDTPPEAFRFVHAANALAAFQTEAFTLLDSPFDRFLEGEDTLSEEARRGAALFYGDAGCARCHGGALMTDQKAHNIGVPQIGPGREPGQPFDEGVYLRRTGEEFRFTFRTPPLRNVAVTGPWMHNGAYTTLEGALRHHLDARRALAEYDLTQLEPALRSQVHNGPEIQAEILKTLSPLLDEPLPLTDEEVSDLLAFLHSLTSPSIDRIEEGFPSEVPSGLPVEECGRQ